VLYTVVDKETSPCIFHKVVYSRDILQRSWKRLYSFVTIFLRTGTLYSRFYQNQSSFTEVMTKTFWPAIY